jgi:hypothetical protein
VLTNWSIVNEKLFDVLQEYDIVKLPVEEIFDFSQSIKSIVDNALQLQTTTNVNNLD